MDSELQNTVTRLISAVNIVMDTDPMTPQAKRLESYQVIEDFKENSNKCAECGFVLVTQEYNSVIRHFGLQLLENSVRYKWNHLTAEVKLNIKSKCLTLVSELIPSEEIYIKDALSRIMVEIIKREWPQQYNSMFEEFSELCKLGAQQTEIVLLIFLRLAEDVVIFRNIPNHRCKDIMEGLNQNMSDIYSFFINTLKMYYQAYQKLKGSDRDEDKAQIASCYKVLQAVFHALTAYVDWIKVSYIYQHENGILLQIICLLLEEELLQLSVAECLLVIINRKGKPEDKKAILVLFSDDAMSLIIKSVRSASTADLEESHYLFLKKLIQVLTALGTQLAAIWGLDHVEGKIGLPATFSKYMDAIFAFTEHSSQTLRHFAISLWEVFLRHEGISNISVIKDIYVPKLISLLTTTILFKVGFPSQHNSKSCEYSRLDFDSDEEFKTFFSRYRNEVSEVIRLSTNLVPSYTFNVAITWLNELLQKEIILGNGCESHCNQSSPSYIEWEAIAVFLENVLTKIHYAGLVDKINLNTCLSMLQTLLNYNTQDPLILSCQMTCISAFVPYLSHSANTLLPSILEKIFSSIVFKIQGQTKATRSISVRDVRKHSCAILIKICKTFPAMLLSVYEEMYAHIKKLTADPEELSQMERSTLLEALVLISNEYNNYNKQVVILGDILKEVKQYIVSNKVKEALSSPSNFLSFVGLDKPELQNKKDSDQCLVNRLQLLYCIQVIYGTLKRCTIPEDEDLVKSGGYILKVQDNKVISKNAATQHIMQMMENVLLICRMLNQLYTPESLSKKHADYEIVYEMSDNERNLILGTSVAIVDRTNEVASKTLAMRIQNFFFTLYDLSYHIAGQAGVSFGWEFYQIPSLGESLSNTVFNNLDFVPDFRLKVILRAFLRPYVFNCPPEFWEINILPILEFMGPYLLQRLSNKWETAKLINEDMDEDEHEIEEVIQDQLLRQVSREYLDFLVHLFKERVNGNESIKSEDISSEPMTEEEQQLVSGRRAHQEVNISALGKVVLSSDNVYPSLVMTLFSGLSWPDTLVCSKCVPLILPILKQLHHGGKVMASDLCHIFTTVLKGLQVLGQHEAQQAQLVTLAFQLYDYFRPQNRELMSVMLQIPNMKQDQLQKLDEFLLKPETPSKSRSHSEKIKKERFKKLISPIIGKNVGQQFKKEVEIVHLPPLVVKARKRKPAPVTETESHDLGLCALFTPGDIDDV